MNTGVKQDGKIMETVCHIEILKDGRDFVTRAHFSERVPPSDFRRRTYWNGYWPSGRTQRI